MKHRWLFLAIGIGLAGTLAYFLRDAINDRIIVPLAYVWWQVGLYYHSFPEDNWWVIVIVMICIMALASMSRDEWFSHDPDPEDTPPAQGPVEELMIWMMKLPHNAYYKWLIANRLGRLARLFLIQRAGRNVQRWDGSLNSPDWNPPEEVGAYLKSGLNRPFADAGSSSAPRPRSRSKPLNLDPQQVVEYLESQMENHRNGN